jgi:hypothetical protein
LRHLSLQNDMRSIKWARLEKMSYSLLQTIRRSISSYFVWTFDQMPLHSAGRHSMIHIVRAIEPFLLFAHLCSSN